MQRSIHYYVLSLSEKTNRLYEGFRDKLIDIHDKNFPFEFSIDNGDTASRDTHIRNILMQTSERFISYYDQDPLQLVVLGKKSSLVIFEALSTHQDALISKVEGDYNATSTHDLGMIVWPVVKEVIGAANSNALRDLAAADKMKKAIFGIEAVGQSAETETGSTLFVEEDYRVKGSIQRSDRSIIISKHVNLLEAIDDVVDIIIEKVLKMGGNVSFLKSGSLKTFKRIALILRY